MAKIQDTYPMAVYAAKFLDLATMEVNLPLSDPIMIQLQQDGYADIVGGKWIARGYIKPGEQRIDRQNGLAEKITG